MKRWAGKKIFLDLVPCMSDCTSGIATKEYLTFRLIPLSTLTDLWISKITLYIYMFLHTEQKKSSIIFFWNMMPRRCVGLATQTFALYLYIFHRKHKISNIANHLVSNQVPSLRLVKCCVDVVDIFVVDSLSQLH